MSNYSTEQYVQAQQANVDGLYRFASGCFGSFEKLVQLNMQTAKTSLAVSQARWLNALSGKGPLAFFEVPAGAQPLAERVAAYQRQCFEILMSAHAALAEQAGAQYERQAHKVQTGIDEAAKSGPAGSEAAVAALHSMISATNSWYDSLYKTARQAVETAESGMNVVAGAAQRAQTTAAHAAGGRK
jgi:phasin family protein